MADLFQIKDYIKINSTDYEMEFMDKFIHFEAPSRDVRFWERNRKKPIAERFRRWLSGETLLIDDNSLTVELPKELVGNEEEIRRMVDVAIGGNDVYQGALPTPDQLLHYYHTEVRLVSGSARWTTSGRCVNITFSTTVAVKGAVSRLTQRELEYGLKDWSVRDNTVFRILQEMVLNPDGVEYVHGSHGNFLIKKSMDENIQRRKFALLYDYLFIPDERNLVRLARIFSPASAALLLKKDALVSQRYAFGLGYRFEKKEHKYQRSFSDGYYSFSCDLPFTLVDDYVRYYESLKDAFGKSLETVVRKKESLKDVPLPKNFIRESSLEVFRFDLYKGSFELQLDPREFFKSHIFSKPLIIDSLVEELKERLGNASAILDFLQRCIVKQAEPGKKLKDALCDCAFEKIWLDPLSYCSGSGDFVKFAQGLVY